jgi:hypothetical protein
MRQAVLHYRTLLEDLVGEPAVADRKTEAEVRYA